MLKIESGNKVVTDDRERKRCHHFVSALKNEQKVPKMVYIIPKFLVLHFGENFMKIQTKIAKLQMHENLHKNVNENIFMQIFMHL